MFGHADRVQAVQASGNSQWSGYKQNSTTLGTSIGLGAIQTSQMATRHEFGTMYLRYRENRQLLHTERCWITVGRWARRISRFRYLMSGRWVFHACWSISPPPSLNLETEKNAALGGKWPLIPVLLRTHTQNGRERGCKSWYGHGRMTRKAGKFGAVWHRPVAVPDQMIVIRSIGKRYISGVR